MPTMQDPLTIVTDLDGSLLDHHTYSWQPAEAWLQRLREHNIPVVICSSKTAAEIIPLQRALGLEDAPFIAENGAVIQWQTADKPEPQRDCGDIDYARLCELLHTLREEFAFKFIGFADVSDSEVAEWTGLPQRSAALARLREASESIIWRDSETRFDLFRERLATLGLGLTQGGRFWHVMRSGSGKGSALLALLKQLSTGHLPLTIGLGDGPNDAEMLDAVDYAVVIKGFSKNPVLLQRADQERIYRTEQYGPQGWSEGLDHFISQ